MSEKWCSRGLKKVSTKPYHSSTITAAKVLELHMDYIAQIVYESIS